MTSRKPVPTETETDVLTKSRRRCALCAHLKNDYTERLGQVAHLDKNPNNNDFDNLAYLCWDHHTLFDSKSSQHKNYTAPEIKHWRNILYNILEQGTQFATQSSPNHAANWDRSVLTRINSLMEPALLTLKQEHFNNHTNRRNFIGLDTLDNDADSYEYKFINPELENLRLILINFLKIFLREEAKETYRTNKPYNEILDQEWRVIEQAQMQVDKYASDLYQAYQNLNSMATRFLPLQP